MNLLTKIEKDNLRKALKVRFSIAVAYLLTVSLLLGFVTLLPAYFLMRENILILKSQNYKNKILNKDSVTEILDLPLKIDSRLKFLQSELTDLSIVNTLHRITEPLSEKVTLNSILFSRNKEYKEKNGTHILISGIAVDRDSLVSFSTRLKESSYFSAVDIPVSSLTKERDFPFSMNIFIKK